LFDVFYPKHLVKRTKRGEWGCCVNRPAQQGEKEGA